MKYIICRMKEFVLATPLFIQETLRPFYIITIYYNIMQWFEKLQQVLVW